MSVPSVCPAGYAYEPEHLGANGINLRQLSDYKGVDLVRRLPAIVDRERPLHLSLLGGEPPVRYRELEVLLPQLEQRGTRAASDQRLPSLPKAWNTLQAQLSGLRQRPSAGA